MNAHVKIQRFDLIGNFENLKKETFKIVLIY